MAIFFENNDTIYFNDGNTRHGYATSWIFGREYSDKTAKDILATPISRANIFIAKMIVVLLWCILLVIVFFICSMIVGFATNLGGLSNPFFIH
ncbi:MAG: ABC transporter permease [bacterium]